MNFYQKFQIFIVQLVVYWLNFVLTSVRRILFRPLSFKPQNILIYKIGNIGDIVCAIPSFIAIRKNFPEAKITLLTSPGKAGGLGAKELLKDVWYLDELRVYYSEDIDSFDKKRNFIRQLKNNHYDLFIQLPDDLANFRTLLRNMIFAKLIGAKAAFGFEIRTIQLFKKTQVDYTSQKTEVESLLELLKERGITVQKVEFDFNVSENQKRKTENLLEEKWRKLNKKEIIVAVGFGGKREESQWPVESFIEIIKYLQNKYNAKVIMVGGSTDMAKVEIIRNNVASDKNILIAAGKLDLLETFELLKHCSFIISNSTGVIHLAAAAGIPAIGFYSIRDVFGRWFPYGGKNQILCHKFINCDYRNESCVKKSIQMITVEEVMNACDILLKKI